MPKFGATDMQTLATQEIGGYWQWSGYQGTQPRFWLNSNPGRPTELTVNLTELGRDQAALARQALATWSDVANVHFTETTGSAQITYVDFHKADGSARADTPQTTFFDPLTGRLSLTSATVDISRDFASGLTSGGTNNYFYQSLVHETGHALGLGHTGNYNGTGNYDSDETLYANDTWQYSVMSYNIQSHFGGSTKDYVMTPQMADILAIQRIYGAATTRTGDSVYGFHSNAGSLYDFAHYQSGGSHNIAPAFTIYDSGGNDTLDCSGFTLSSTINLQGGSFSSVGGQKNNIGIFTTSTIENAVGGSGGDTIVGNAVGNVITGGTGFDKMTGLGGADTFIFFKGDTRSTRSTADTITDFHHTDGDIIDFTHRDANSVLAGDQAFTFIGNQAFHKVAGELHTIQEANDTWIEGDTNGNGKADFIIHLTGSIQLQSTDFHL